MTPNSETDGEVTVVYLEHEYLAGCAVYVELAVGRVVRIDALPGQEIDDVLRTILVAVRSRNLIRGKSKNDMLSGKTGKT